MTEQILILVFLILLNGLFAMSEIAIVSSRKSRLEDLMRKGNKKAKLVLHLSESPNRFLSTIQVGITLIAILIGVFGGTGLAHELDRRLLIMGMAEPLSYNLSLIIVIFLITFFSIIVGELVPKRIGMGPCVAGSTGTIGKARYRTRLLPAGRRGDGRQP